MIINGINSPPDLRIEFSQFRPMPAGRAAAARESSLKKRLMPTCERMVRKRLVAGMTTVLGLAPFFAVSHITRH